MNRAPRKIVIKGTSAAGTSTLAADLVRQLGVISIELDALHHGPNWSAPTSEDFRARVRESMAAAPDGWVIDSNYDSKLDDTVVTEADTTVWLWRLWGRTTDRILNQVDLWNGNRDSWRGAFLGRESLFAWALRSHVRHRREWPGRFGQHPRFVRLRSDAEVCRWLREPGAG